MSERYGFSLTTFSPSGKLVQIEYALNAVAAGAPSVGIKGQSYFFTLNDCLDNKHYSKIKIKIFHISYKWCCIGDRKKTKNNSK
jgi:20S proteasome alpha/beta subunit